MNNTKKSSPMWFVTGGFCERTNIEIVKKLCAMLDEARPRLQEDGEVVPGE